MFFSDSRVPKPSRRPTRPLSRFLAGTLAAWLACGPVLAASASDLQNDIAHYRRTAEQRRLGANDRLYILMRLRQKYADSKLDLSGLEAELAMWRDRRAADAKPKAPAAKPAPAAAKPSSAPARGPALTHIRIEDEASVTKLVLAVTGPVAPQAVWVEDAMRPQQPMLLIDLPRTRNLLSQVARDMLWGSGPLISATTAMNGEDVRVQIILRGKHPYRVVRAQDDIIVEVRNDPSPGAPAKAAAPAATQGAEETADRLYVVQPGDILDIDVQPAKELSRESVVSADGTLLFPLLGALNVRGITLEQVEKTLAAKLAPYVPKPRVAATAKRSSDRNVFLTGQVARPGAIPFRADLHLLEALAQAGGFAEDADDTAVKIHRGGQDGGQVLDVNPRAILAQGDLSLDVPLEAGDVIEVPRGTNSIFVIGRVAKPGNYPFKDGLTVFETVTLAGGASMGAKTDAIKVFRQNGGGREVLKVNLARIMAGRPEGDVTLKAGDIVLVPERSFFGTSTSNAWLTPWLYLATLIAAVAIAS